MFETTKLQVMMRLVNNVAVVCDFRFFLLACLVFIVISFFLFSLNVFKTNYSRLKAFQRYYKTGEKMDKQTKFPSGDYLWLCFSLAM